MLNVWSKRFHQYLHQNKFYCTIASARVPVPLRREIACCWGEQNTIINKRPRWRFASSCHSHWYNHFKLTVTLWLYGYLEIPIGFVQQGWFSPITLSSFHLRVYEVSHSYETSWELLYRLMEDISDWSVVECLKITTPTSWWIWFICIVACSNHSHALASNDYTLHTVVLTTIIHGTAITANKKIA